MELDSFESPRLLSERALLLTRDTVADKTRMFLHLSPSTMLRNSVFGSSRSARKSPRTT